VNLLLELVIPLVLAFMVVVLHRRTQRNAEHALNNPALLFMLIALSASVPLIVSLKQRTFYLIPSIPFYVLSIGFFILRPLQALISRIPAGWLKWMNRSAFVAMFAILMFSVFRFGVYLRDEQKLRDVYTLSEHLPEGTILSTNSALWSDWYLVAYLSRVGYLSLDDREGHEYYLIQKDAAANFPEGYELIDLPLNHYLLGVLVHKPLTHP
jgi:hypothetical protein